MNDYSASEYSTDDFGFCLSCGDSCSMLEHCCPSAGILFEGDVVYLDVLEKDKEK